jgi:hypothetical protein
VTESPSGLIDGTNKVFTLSAVPLQNTTILFFKNGVLQAAGNDYVLEGSTITFEEAPYPGDYLVAFFNGFIPLTQQPTTDFVELSDSWKWMVRRETINYSEAEPVVLPPITVPNTKRRAITKEDITLMPEVLKRASTIWHLWRSQIPGGLTPKIGGTIQDSLGSRWNVRMVQIQSFGNRFRCTCLLEG